MKKKQIAETLTEEQFEDFNAEDFSDLNDLAENEEQYTTDDPLADNFETEFHGADPDLPPTEQEDIVRSKRSAVDVVKENWLYVGIGIIVLCVAIYLIMDFFSSPNQPAQPAAQATQQTATAGFNNVPTTQQDLTLRAVVPGRAWLVDGNGRNTN